MLGGLKRILNVQGRTPRSSCLEVTALKVCDDLLLLVGFITETLALGLVLGLALGLAGR